jgi:glycosyltransferase involved in cell wall biosynthesis
MIDSAPIDPHVSPCELTILMPCLNEAETLATCVGKARRFLTEYAIDGEIVVADNGSNDGSQSLAKEHGARVVDVPVRGYGGALAGGIAAARGRFIVMGDSDDSYDFSNLMPFIEKLRDGYELVMGNRFKGGIAPRAMPPLHRYLGNPVLTGIGRLFFQGSIRDFHCGLRGFNRDSIVGLDLKTTGMEFASEMVVKATLQNLRITEVPTTLSPDGRSRPPHLRSWRDGWRHLRFLLIYAPHWLFLYPGMALALTGLLLLVWLAPGPRVVGHITLDIHTMLYAAMGTVVGFNTMAFAVFAKVYAGNAGLIPAYWRLKTFVREATLERGLILGGLLALGGGIASAYAVIVWGQSSFGPLVPTSMMRVTIPALTALALGIEIMFSSFFLSVLNLQARR